MFRAKKKKTPSSKENDGKTITEMEAMMKSVRAQMATLESMIAKEKDAQAKKSGDDIANDVEDGNQQDNSSTEEVENELSSQDVKQILFEGSTHRFLFLNTIKEEDGKEYRVGCWNKFIAVGVLAIQFYSYYILMWMIWTADTGSVPLEIDHEFCFENEKLIANEITAPLLSTYDLMLEFLSCGTTYKKQREAFHAFLPGILLLLCFLSQDFFESLVLFKCRGCKAKFTAIIIFLEALLAIVIAIVGTIQAGAGAFGKLDTYLLIVGIIFAHDVDEQVGYWKAVERRLGQTFKCLEIQFWVIVLLIFCLCYWLNDAYEI